MLKKMTNCCALIVSIYSLNLSSQSESVCSINILLV